MAGVAGVAGVVRVGTGVRTGVGTGVVRVVVPLSLVPLPRP